MWFQHISSREKKDNLTVAATAVPSGGIFDQRPNAPAQQYNSPRYEAPRQGSLRQPPQTARLLEDDFR